jgi:hypothetical protein
MISPMAGRTRRGTVLAMTSTAANTAILAGSSPAAGPWGQTLGLALVTVGAGRRIFLPGTPTATHIEPESREEAS